MILCKIQCPSCGAGHDVPFDSLSEANSLECSLCGHDFPLSSEEKSKPVKQKQKQKAKTQNKLSSPSAKKKTARRPAVKRKKPSSNSSKYLVNVCIGGLALILVLVLGVKLFSGSKTEPQPVVQKDEVSTEVTALKKQLLEKQVVKEKAPLAKQTKTSAVSEETKEVVELSSYTNSDSSNLVVQEAEDAPSFAKSEPVKEVSVEEQAPEVEERKAEPVSTVARATTAKIILIESEQNELNELDKIPMRELTEEEKATLSMLKNKYNWYKANRYKMTREKLDYEWDRRWADIQASNAAVKSRSDAMLTRPLQILLENAKTQKERAYMMRIFQRPVSFEEKEIVRKARNQAIWERRKSEGPVTYPEDRKKKKNKKYFDEYGYEYYLDDNGQRVYL